MISCNQIPRDKNEQQGSTVSLMEISLLLVVSKMLNACKKDGGGSRFSERAHFYTISGEMVLCALRGPAETALRLLRRCRSVQGADAPCAACAAIPISHGRFPGTVGDSPPDGKIEYRFPRKTVCRVSR